MRTYLILKEKVARFNADAEIQGCCGELRARGRRRGERVTFTPERARDAQGRRRSISPRMRAQGYAYERLDQLTMELLLGVR